MLQLVVANSSPTCHVVSGPRIPCVSAEYVAANGFFVETDTCESLSLIVQSPSPLSLNSRVSLSFTTFQSTSISLWCGSKVVLFLQVRIFPLRVVWFRSLSKTKDGARSPFYGAGWRTTGNIWDGIIVLRVVVSELSTTTQSLMYMITTAVTSFINSSSLAHDGVSC